MYKIVRKFAIARIREYCIRENLYTCGNNSDYGKMFDMAANAKTDGEFIAVCADIWEHSDNTKFISDGGEFEDFAYGIIEYCLIQYVEKEAAINV